MKKVFLATFLGIGIMVNAQDAAQENVQTTQSNETVAPAVEVVEEVAEPVIYSTTSKVENSGFLQTVGFDGAWKFDLNLDNKKIILTGGALVNKAASASNKIRLMVYLADKPFDLNNPQFIGKVYSVVDLESLGANVTESGQTYSTSWASETPLTAGKYYPYILLGEQNEKTGEFEVKDVKAFDKSVTLS